MRNKGIAYGYVEFIQEPTCVEGCGWYTVNREEKTHENIIEIIEEGYYGCENAPDYAFNVSIIKYNEYKTVISQRTCNGVGEWTSWAITDRTPNIFMIRDEFLFRSPPLPKNKILIRDKIYQDLLLTKSQKPYIGVLALGDNGEDIDGDNERYCERQSNIDKPILDQMVMYAARRSNNKSSTLKLDICDGALIEKLDYSDDTNLGTFSQPEADKYVKFLPTDM